MSQTLPFRSTLSRHERMAGVGKLKEAYECPRMGHVSCAVISRPEAKLTVYARGVHVSTKTRWKLAPRTFSTAREL